MKNILLPLFFLINSFVYAQVGIGTTSPDASSMLDIKSANAGLLIPRVSLTSTMDITTIVNPATSLLVYNTSSVSDVTPGFYYWETVWKSFKGSTPSVSSTSWNLTGNNITSTDFLGSTNYQALLFRVNNTLFSRYHPLGGIAIGNNSAANDNQSIAIGTNAKALVSNESIAIGKDAIASNFRTNAIGYDSRASNNNAFALGNSSRATGQQATAVGAEANSSAQNATAIGYQATATQSNSIILGSSSNGNNKVGIGTNTPDERLHIAGSIKIVDGTQGAGRVLTSDVNGKATWVSPSSTKAYADIYYNGSGQTITNSANVTFGATNISQNITVNNNNLQVQTTGKYKITYRISLSKSNGGTDIIRYNLYRGFSNLIPGSLASISIRRDEEMTVTASVIVNLTAFDQISVRGNTTDTNITVLGNGTTLSIELID